MDFYGTIGPACADAVLLQQMVEAGMTGIRMNLSHGPLAAHADWLALLRKAGVKKLLVDLQGPELRIGRLPQPLSLTAGQTVRLGAQGIPCPAALVHSVQPGQELLLDDGKLLARVDAVEPEALVCTVVRGGVLQSRKSLAAPGADIQMPTLTTEDKENLAIAAGCGVTGVMLPFVRGAADICNLRQALAEAGAPQLKILAKIENLAGVQALPEFLQLIARKVKSGAYEDKEFRIASYKAYSHPEFAAKVRNINALNKFDNPTGIAAEKGDEILVFVGPTHGEDIALASVSPAGIESSTYPLNEGVNKIKINRSGLLYVMYHTDISTPKKPVKVHIPVGSGTVNGYFDVTRHTDKDWKRMIGKAPHSMFDIVGRYSMMILHTEYLKAYSPDSITKSVMVWDESVRAMWKIMGFDKYPQPHNNRQLGVSVEGGAHMFATWYYCGYSVGDQGNTLKNEVLAPGVLQGNRLWGFGHEVGHCYQHPFNWRSMSESSNNFFAQLILDQVTNPINGNELASDMENPCKYLLSEAVKGLPFHDLNGWAKWGFAQYSFYLYFHKLGINPEFYPALFESLRRKPLSRQAYEVSEAHLALYERICNVSRTDFTDDFEIFNWFVPIDHKGNQYGDYSFKMTEEMARASKARIAARRYPKPKFRIAFLHQHGKTVDLWGQNLHGSQLNGYWTKYKQNAKLSPSVSASKKDSMIIVRNGENAAAFCVVTNGKVVGYYDRQKFDVSGVEWNDTSKVYAIPIQTAEPYKLIYSATRS